MASCYFATPAAARARHKCLDFDEKWESDAGFVKYDFNKPLELPEELKGTMAYVVIDPPFITEEVWVQYTATAKWLLAPGGKVLCSTIAENAEMMAKLLDVHPQAFRPSIPHLVYQYSLLQLYLDALWRAEPRDRLIAYKAAPSWCTDCVLQERACVFSRRRVQTRRR